MDSATIRVLLVSKQPEWLDAFASDSYGERGLAVEAVNDLEEARVRIRESGADYGLVVVDPQAGTGPNARRVLSEIQAAHPSVETLLCAGPGDAGGGAEAAGPPDARALLLHARHASERRSLEAELRRLGQERDSLRGLLRVSRALTTSLDVVSLAREVYRQLSQQLPRAGAFYLAIYEEAHDELSFVLTVDEGREIEKFGRSLSSEEERGLAGHIVRTLKPLVIGDLHAEEPPEPARSFHLGRPSRTYVGHPLVSDGRLVGVMSVQSYEPDAFDEEARGFIREVADQAGAAIENALMHERQSARRLLVLSKLYKTLGALRDGVNPQPILKLILEDLQELFGLDACAVALVEAEAGLRFVVTRGAFGAAASAFAGLSPESLGRLLGSSELVEVAPGKHPDAARLLPPGELSYFAVLPLCGGPEPLGLIIMGARRPLRLPQEQRDLLKAMADQAAIAIHSARLHTDTEASASQDRALDLVLLEIANQSEGSVLLGKIIELARDLLHASGGGVYLLNKAGDEFTLAAVQGLPGLLEGSKRGTDGGVVGEVYKIGKPFAVSGYREWEGRFEALDNFNLTAAVGAPIIHGGRLLGVLVVHDTKEGKVFSEAEGALLARFAAHAGVAIQKVDLLEELKVVSELSTALASPMDYRELVDRVTSVISDVLGYENSTVFIKDEIANELDIVGGPGREPEGPGARIRIGREKGVTGYAAATGETVIVPDVSKEPRYIQGHPDGRSEIAVPLKVGGKVIGVLDIESSELNAFGERDSRILERVAPLIASAIENARLLEDARQNSEQKNALAGLSNAVVGSSSLSEGLQYVARALMRAYPASFCHILLTARDGRYLRLRAAYPPPGDGLAASREPIIGTTCEMLHARRVYEAVQTSPHVAFVRGDGGDRFLDEYAAHISLGDPLRRAVLLPLRAGAQLVGVCVLGQVGEGPAELPDPPDLAFATALAGQAAVAIDKARGHEFALEGMRSLGRLNKAGTAIAASLNLDQTLDLIARYGRSLLNAEVCSVFLVRRKGILSLEAGAGYPEGTFRRRQEAEIRTGTRTGLIGHIAHQAKPFNMKGRELLEHPAVREPGPHDYLPSGYCTSMMAYPLKRRTDDGEQVIGLITSVNKTDRTRPKHPDIGFDDMDMSILESLAGFAETAIQNATLFELANSWQKVSKAVYSTLFLDDVLQRVLSELHDLLPFKTTSIQLLVGGDLKVVACHGFSEEEGRKVLQLTFPLEPQFPNYEVIERQRPVRIADIRATDFRHFWDEAETYCTGAIRSWMGVPLLHDGKVVGMLSIEDDVTGRYTAEHEEIGMAFAEQVVSAIVNARLFETSQNLAGVARDISNQLDLQAVLRKTAEDAARPDGFIAADVVSIYLYHPERKSFAESVAYAGSPRHPEMMTPPFGEQAAPHQLLRLGREHVADKVEGDQVFDQGFARREGVESAAGFPLVIGEETVGVLFISYRKAHEFSKEEVGLLKLFAQQAAIAIHNARRFDAVTQRLERAGTVALYLAMMSAWSHDAADETHSIRTDVRTLRNHLRDDARALEILDRLKEASDRVATLIPKIPPRATRRGPVSVGEVFRKAVRDREEELRKRAVEVDARLDHLPEALASGWLLERAFVHLMNNAANSMPGGGRITVTGHEEGSRLRLKFTDTRRDSPSGAGAGLFKRGPHHADFTGSGVDLWLAWVYLNACDGDIDIEDSDETGTTFALSVPTG